MKTIAIFAEEHEFDADELRGFAGNWFPHMDCDQPLWAVLHAYRVMDENGIDEDDTEAFMEYLALQCWNVEYAGSSFDEAYERGQQWESLDDFAHDHLMETSELYQAVMNGCHGFTVDIDTVAFQCEYSITRSGYVFRSI
ncbi:hypothetical protein ACFYYS_00320 [Streptomyces sp. NPDC002120]|uniref:hypothetical protein n=1 Tax=Streptomyces sp. NPDC002120 TaxID=3364631 RepID=UPI0036AD44EE